jgi:hypothetical protein
VTHVLVSGKSPVSPEPANASSSPSANQPAEPTFQKAASSGMRLFFDGLP